MTVWFKPGLKTVRNNRLIVSLAFLCLLGVTGSAAAVLGGLETGTGQDERADEGTPAGSTKGGSVRADSAAGEQETPSARTAAIVPLPVAGADRGFLARPEKSILDRLREAEIAKVTRSSVGRSVAFKITLRDGTRGYYKPEQSFSSANWYAEVVAYYLDRALGLGLVPPVVSRRLPWSRLRKCSRNKERFDEVRVSEDGTVRGAFIWWLPKRLREIDIHPGWENWIRIEPWQSWRITPFQRPCHYTRELENWRQHGGNDPKHFFQQVPEPDREDRAAELSDLIVFDYLTLNNDRWGGGNANVLTYGKDRRLIFLDNGAGFSPGPPKRGLMQDRLRVLQRFRRSTIEALRAFDVDSFADTLARDRLAPLLGEGDLKGLEIRRQSVLDRVQELQKSLGDDVLSW